MNSTFDLPSGEHFLSAVSLTADDLSVRLATDYHSGSDGTAYELLAHGLHRIEGTVHQLERLKESREYVYVYWRETQIILEGEHGDEIHLEATSFSAKSAAPNLEELRSALGRSRLEYEAESNYSRRTTAKLQHVRDLLVEQARRIEIKATSHEPNSAAGVLYEQQVQFIERLLRETDA